VINECIVKRQNNVNKVYLVKRQNNVSDGETFYMWITDLSNIAIEILTGTMNTSSKGNLLTALRS
jgi:hypothetical protein